MFSTGLKMYKNVLCTLYQFFNKKLSMYLSCFGILEHLKYSLEIFCKSIKAMYFALYLQTISFPENLLIFIMFGLYIYLLFI